jgi:hypothetical protein
MRLSAPNRTPERASFVGPCPLKLRRKCECGTHGGETCAKCAGTPPTLQRRAAGDAGHSSAPPLVHEVLGSPGQALDARARADLEPRFGRDFSDVRVHTDARARESASSVNARAYAVGRDIVFGAGGYAPASAEGRRLLAHELAHVVQQGGRALMPMAQLEVGAADSSDEREADRMADAATSGRPVPPASFSAGATLRRDDSGAVRAEEGKPNPRERLKLDYKKAEQANKAHAKAGPSWESKLATVAKGKYKAWHELWSAGDHRGFADQVASYQIDLGLPEKQIDGVLGPGTWARLAGMGEAMAGIEKVIWPQSEKACTVAAVERIKRGHALAKGKAFELPEDKTISVFNTIAQTFTERMLDLDPQYRGTGPAGALVYAGMGQFVSEADIWAGKLKPGAALQVWGSRKDYDLLRVGEVNEGKKKRRIRDSDASFYGTAFVFVRYDTNTNQRMLVRHFGSAEWKDKSMFQVWVAANLSEP